MEIYGWDENSHFFMLQHEVSLGYIFNSVNAVRMFWLGEGI